MKLKKKNKLNYLSKEFIAISIFNQLLKKKENKFISREVIINMLNKMTKFYKLKLKKDKKL